MRSLLAIRTLEPEEILDLLGRAARFREALAAGEQISRPRRSIGMLFFENSTRTRVSFEQAAFQLGMRSVNFSGEGSSASKGETLKDTILTLRHEKLEGLVVRHRSSGSAQLAAEHFGGPVVNAGDGEHEHPTQALGDALTIQQRLGRIDGLRIAIIGDVLHSRVARSNAWLLSKLGAEVRFIGPRTLLPSHTSRLPGEVYYDLRSGLAGCHAAMCLRLQHERMREGMFISRGEFTRLYQINRASLKAADPDCIVMHPGPLNRGIEIDDETADSPRSAVTDQITNGIYVRMAALDWVFEEGAA